MFQRRRELALDSSNCLLLKDSTCSSQNKMFALLLCRSAGNAPSGRPSITSSATGESDACVRLRTVESPTAIISTGAVTFVPAVAFSPRFICPDTSVPSALAETRLAKTATMAMTTRSSISVNAALESRPCPNRGWNNRSRDAPVDGELRLLASAVTELCW